MLEQISMLGDRILWVVLVHVELKKILPKKALINLCLSSAGYFTNFQLG